MRALETPPPAPALAAASLLLLRDGDAGLKVFHVRRAATMAFSAHATAFPGGRVDPADDAALAPAVTTAPGAADLDAWARRLGLADRPVETQAQDEPAAVAARFLAAVVRETFEETGVLLARTVDGGPAGAETAAALAPRRAAVERHEQEFVTLLAEHGLVPDAAGLRAWQRWITPVGVPRRYDTAFFLVAVPEGQEPDRLTTEATEHGWAAPAALIEAFRAGEVNLMTPTWAQLRALRDLGSVAEALEAGAADTPIPVVQLMPDRSPDGRREEFAHADEYLADVRSFRAHARVAETPDNIL